MGMIFEALLNVVLYLVDWLRWWRFIVSVLFASGVSIICYNMGSEADIYPSVLVLVVTAVGVVIGLVWEYRTGKIK